MTTDVLSRGGPLKIALTQGSFLLTLMISTLGSPAVTAVELEQLQIPKTYRRYLPQLLDGAKLMATSERCIQFLSGRVNADRSTLKHPVFIYTCRDAENQTYSLNVDGLSQEILDPTRPEGRISFADIQAEIDRERKRQVDLADEIHRLEEQKIALQVARDKELAHQAELAREEEARLAEIARRQQLWQLCTQQLDAQVVNMQEVRWLSRSQPEAEALDDGRYRFAVDFDAVDPQGRALAYRVYCMFAAEGEMVTLKIHPRGQVAGPAQ